MRGNEGLLQCMLQKTLKQGVGKWCPSTTGPLLPTMTDSLLAPGREVLYKRYHTGELRPATILGPCDDGDDFVRLKYSRNERDYENPSAPLSAGRCSPSGVAHDSSGVDDSDSDDDRECDVVWAKSWRGVWGLCHVFEDTLYLTRDLMEDSVVPSNLFVPKVSDSDGAATSARAKKSPKPGEHVQLFRMKRDRNKGFYSEKC